MVEDIAKYLVGEWAVISGAPGAFLLAVILVAGLIWAAMKWAYSARLQNKDSLIELQTAQLGDYKQKLDGASPDQAKARIDALEAQLNKLVSDVAPRTIDGTQRNALRQAALIVGPHRIDVMHDVASSDGRKLSAQFEQVFQAAGWAVRSAAVMGPGNSPPSGIGLWVTNPKGLTQVEAAVVQGLTNAGIVFDLQAVPSPRNPGDPNFPEVSLMVGTRQ